MKQRLSAATPGPWSFYRSHEGWDIVAADMPVTDNGGTRWQEADFIAHAPTDLALAQTVIDVAKIFMANWRGMNTAFEAIDAYNCPMAETVEAQLRVAVDAYEAAP